jgi:hypothetical protein
MYTLTSSLLRRVNYDITQIFSYRWVNLPTTLAKVASPRVVVVAAPVVVEVGGLLGVLLHVPTTVVCLALLRSPSARFAARKIT